MKCGGEQPSCKRCRGKSQSCCYVRTTKDDAVQREAAENARRDALALEQAAAKVLDERPDLRTIFPRLEEPAAALVELPAASEVSPPCPEQSCPQQAYPMQAYPEQSYSTTAYPTQSYSTAAYPGQSYSTATYPAQSYSTATYPTQSYSTVAYPTQSHSTTAYPTQINPDLLDSNISYPHKSDTKPGDWDSGLFEWSQYPQGANSMSEGLGSRPDDASQYHQHYQLARTNFSQPLYGQLPYNRELGFAAGSSTDQLGGIGRYPRASNMVYDGGATRQDTYLPNEYQTGMDSMFVGLPAASSYNTQTPTQSSHYNEQAAVLAQIAAMMPLRDDG